MDRSDYSLIVALWRFIDFEETKRKMKIDNLFDGDPIDRVLVAVIIEKDSNELCVTRSCIVFHFPV